jgi:hypothetical protein
MTECNRWQKEIVMHGNWYEMMAVLITVLDKDNVIQCSMLAVDLSNSQTHLLGCNARHFH